MCKLGKLGLGLVLLVVCVPASASDLAILRNGFSVRHEKRAVIGAVTRLYPSTNSDSYIDIPTDQIDHFEKDLWSPPAATHAGPERLKDVISEVSGRHHLDPDLVSSVIRAESGFNPRAVSPKGAQGLMQLMPHTASQLGVDDAFDANANVEGGSRYLRELLERYNFDLIKALAAYNAGPQRVEQYRGLPPYFETRAYVSRVIRDFNRKKLAEKKAAATEASKKKSAPHAMQSASQ
ncbi:MAG: lytic transglycosylase domain-containing protein [Acidobacteriia bacterium]|nr:lytic transglycosylase domain-containing protein [Terriglobia bacterium]